MQSYPTITFFGFDAKENPIEEEFDGDHHWEDIQDFYEDVKNPSGSFSKFLTVICNFGPIIRPVFRKTIQS